jgi:hypothetical protein
MHESWTGQEKTHGKKDKKNAFHMISKKWYRQGSFSYGELNVNGDLEEFTVGLCISDITIVTVRRKSAVLCSTVETFVHRQPFGDCMAFCSADRSLSSYLSTKGVLRVRAAILYHAR